MRRVHWERRNLDFRFRAGTSKGVLTDKRSWYLYLSRPDGQWAIGECSLIPKISPDDRPDYESVIDSICRQYAPDWILEEAERPRVSAWLEEAPVLRGFPALVFALETLWYSYHAAAPFVLLPSDFTLGKSTLPINGLVWMNAIDQMEAQAREKIAAGYTVIKLKIGALDWPAEYGLLTRLRQDFPDLEIRVDANGGLPLDRVQEQLNALADLQIESIEQPIGRGQASLMRKLCSHSPIAIALDEELAGLYWSDAAKQSLLTEIVPQMLVLKPSLLGGLSQTADWIRLAESQGLTWWVTSALESNIGLNAIAQFVASYQPIRAQGLGTGQLFHNNWQAPLEAQAGRLSYHPDTAWGAVSQYLDLPK